MTELIFNECMEKAQAESSLAKPNSNDDMNIELSKEFLMKLQSNAYHEMFDVDVVDHIAKVLEILDLIKISYVDSHQLRIKVFPLSRADDARQWWINEGEGKITTWEDLVEKFFCKFYPESRDGEAEMRVDGRTKKALFHSWINGTWNKRPMNDIVSSDEEWEESDYGNPPNTTIDSFLKPYLKAQDISNIEKEGERSQKKRKDNNSNLKINTLNKVPKSDNKNDEQPNKRVCKVEKFKAITYSLGPNEEFIAMKSCKYNAWEKNKYSVS
ncbi:hypothetical protein Tco_1470768 [Tanacetum coccineum]